MVSWSKISIHGASYRRSVHHSSYIGASLRTTYQCENCGAWVTTSSRDDIKECLWCGCSDLNDIETYD